MGDYDKLGSSGGGLTTSSLMRKSVSRMSASTQRSRGVRDRKSSSGSATTLPVASGHVKLISNAESIFEIIESHQVQHLFLLFLVFYLILVSLNWSL